MNVRRRLQGGQSGIATFFEDIPSLLVVMISIAVFIFSSAYAYTAYLAQRDATQWQTLSLDFAKSIRAYDGLTYNLQEGVFDADKLLTLTPEKLNTSFNPETLGFKYQLIVEDKSMYPDASLRFRYPRAGIWFSTPPQGFAVYTTTLPVVIRVDADEMHPGNLIVSIWK